MKTLTVEVAKECALPFDPLLLGVVIGIAIVLCVTVLAILFHDWLEKY